MTQYMGIDWLAVCLTFPAIHLLTRHSRNGFLLMMVGNVCWAVIGFWAASYAMTIANLCFLSMNLHAYMSWSHGDPRPMRSPPQAGDGLAEAHRQMV